MTLTVQKLTQYADHSKKYLYKNVSLKFDNAGFYAVVGQRELMLFLAGLKSPTSGTVNFNGKNIQKIGLNKYRNEKISLLFSDGNLIDYMTPVENIMSALSITNSKHAGSKRYAMDLLSQVGVENSFLKRVVSDLSLEQRQLIALARALAVDAPIILADNPTEKLDTAAAKRLLTAFAAAAHEWKKTVIISTDSEELASRADVRIKFQDHHFVTEKLSSLQSTK
ncbi:ATP-binding cassette domain-containing protein [Oenococcus kitaharae]|uniref:ABC-type antimicrobial peptide transport system ATPase component n=1 Tax=Oenococcus kitaharae DSM 17330 TaxID=1045004 RepID=G9WIF3_9LACO|nr:ATP-binding cassette domain-containing protein [Oenococcus kitaharae]EHN58965.1 ABC-type antimicrobial peptide transport system ATPase component [Oenococcus kitaharae DSM 17330]OEY81725.1 ABC transporter [Oenococcus kitaharae]OEY83956.1 ABC transporter [Oenococcus kitaharae]OEY85688.1 ABC transporter [Oenococcus kitaharae]